MMMFFFFYRAGMLCRQALKKVESSESIQFAKLITSKLALGLFSS
jgi:hypothetical protein